MRMVIVKLTICFILSISVMLLLFATSVKMTHERNSFHRLFPPHPATRIQSFDLKLNSFYFAGTDTNQVYLSNITAPLYLLTLNGQRLDTAHLKLRVKNIKDTRFRNGTRVAVLPPFFYIMDGISPRLLRGTLGEWQAEPFMYDSIYFSLSVPIGSKAFAIRAVSSHTKEYILGKQTDHPPYVQIAQGILEKQIDGIFCTDGMLHYNKKRKEIIYLYHYRNQYMVMDSTLRLVSIGKTIDTNSIAKIQIATMNTTSTQKMSAPPYLINKHSATEGNLLFVNSGLMAKNEDRESFNTSSVIDVYNLEKSTYEFSFYLARFKGYAVTDFIVDHNHLYALHNRYLVIYSLEHTLFSKL